MKRARGRDREGFASTLAVWIIEDGTKRGTLHIECPHCGGKAIISEKLWINEPRNSCGPFIGRPCTYCFKTSRLTRKRMSKAAKIAYQRGDT